MKAKNQTVSSEIEAKEKLIVYVYEYLLHTGAKQAAHSFLGEIRFEKAIQPSESPGFLVNWWSVFWDLYSAAPDKRTNQAEPSNDARAFQEYYAPLDHQMMHQQPPPPPTYQQNQSPYMPAIYGGPGTVTPNMQEQDGPSGSQRAPHHMSQQMMPEGGGPSPPHANGRRTRKKKAPKDVNQHKCSGYAQFFSDKQKQIKSADPTKGQDFGEISKMISAEWSSLSDQEKNQYNKQVIDKKRQNIIKKASEQAKKVQSGQIYSNNETD